jgi:hypothetical protein
MTKERLLFLILFLIIGNATLFSQSIDTVYMKSGDIICGTIIKNVPGEPVSIQRIDKLILTINRDEILSMNHEPGNSTQTEELLNSTSPNISGLIIGFLSLGVIYVILMLTAK